MAIPSVVVEVPGPQGPRGDALASTDPGNLLSTGSDGRALLTHRPGLQYNPLLDVVWDSCWREVGSSTPAIVTDSGHTWEAIEGVDGDSHSLGYRPGGGLTARALGTVNHPRPAHLISDFTHTHPYVRVRIASTDHQQQYIYAKWIDQNNWIGLTVAQNTFTVSVCVNGVIQSPSGVTHTRSSSSLAYHTTGAAGRSSGWYSVSVVKNHTIMGASSNAVWATGPGYEAAYGLSVDSWAALSGQGKVGVTGTRGTVGTVFAAFEAGRAAL